MAFLRPHPHAATNPCQNPGRACLTAFLQAEGMFDGLRKGKKKPNWGQHIVNKTLTLSEVFLCTESSQGLLNKTNMKFLGQVGFEIWLHHKLLEEYFKG